MILNIISPKSIQWNVVSIWIAWAMFWTFISMNNRKKDIAYLNMAEKLKLTSVVFFHFLSSWLVTFYLFMFPRKWDIIILLVIVGRIVTTLYMGIKNGCALNVLEQNIMKVPVNAYVDMYANYTQSSFYLASNIASDFFQTIVFTFVIYRIVYYYTRKREIATLFAVFTFYHQFFNVFLEFVPLKWKALKKTLS